MTKYIARLDGIVVGKRTTKDRTYTHCVVTQRDEVEAAQAAYDYTPTSTDLANYGHYAEIAKQGLEHEHIRVNDWRKQPDLDYLARCQEAIVGGINGYIVRLRQEAIERFEAARKAGAYQPRSHSWCGRLDLAQKEASRVMRFNKHVWIVEAEVV